MAQVTKLELQQRLAAAHQEILALRTRVSVLEGEATLRSAPRIAATSWQRPAYMEAARATAMRLGKPVRAGAAR